MDMGETFVGNEESRWFRNRVTMDFRLLTTIACFRPVFDLFSHVRPDESLLNLTECFFGARMRAVVDRFEDTSTKTRGDVWPDDVMTFVDQMTGSFDVVGREHDVVVGGDGEHVVVGSGRAVVDGDDNDVVVDGDVRVVVEDLVR